MSSYLTTSLKFGYPDLNSSGYMTKRDKLPTIQRRRIRKKETTTHQTPRLLCFPPSCGNCTLRQWPLPAGRPGRPETHSAHNTKLALLISQWILAKWQRPGFGAWQASRKIHTAQRILPSMSWFQRPSILFRNRPETVRIFGFEGHGACAVTLCHYHRSSNRRT